MTSQFLAIWLVLASGVQLGTLWIMKLSILPMLNALSYDRYVTVCQLIDMHVFHPIALWNGVVSAVLGVGLAIAAPSPGVAVLFVAGSVGMGIVGLASEGVNRPIWRQIERWSPNRLSDCAWDEKRRRWHVAHQIRTYGSVAALVFFTAAATML
jgi:uncharacterized membrane protein